MERMIIAHNRVCREEGEKGIGGLDCDQVAAFHGFRHSTGFPRFFSPKTRDRRTVDPSIHIRGRAAHGDGAHDGRFLLPRASAAGGGGGAESEALGILGETFGVIVTPGVAFGCPGYLRVSYGSLPDDELGTAADRLRDGLKWLSQNKPGSAPLK